MTLTARHDPYAALRIANYRWFIISLLTMTAASQMQGVAVGWQIYSMTHAPLSLGLIGLAEAVPFIAVALVAGHVADIADRRRIALWSLAVLLVCSVALLVLALRLHDGGPSPLGMRDSRVWTIYAVIFASGVARGFLQPARSALSAELVPRELYANAVTWRSSTWQFAEVVGPAVGGLLYGFAGAPAAYAVDVALMAMAVVALIRVSHVSEVRTVTGSVLESLKTGLRFVWHEQVVLGALTLDMFAVLFGGATALLPVFANEILHVGPQGLGVLRAAPAVGAVVTSVALAHRRPFERTGHTLLWAVALFGLAMIGFGLSHNFLLSLTLLALSGAVDTVSVVVRSTLLQVMTPPSMLGRVSSVNAIFIGSSNEIGAFESGVAATVLGAARSVVAGGVATLIVVGAVATRMPALRRLRRIQ